MSIHRSRRLGLKDPPKHLYGYETRVDPVARLKERRQEQHALEQYREETREMDEMAVLRYRLSPVSPGASAREVTS